MSRDPDHKPKIRNIEPVPAMIEGKSVVVLKDPLELSDQAIVLDREGLMIVSLFDGARTLRDIQYTLTKFTGGLVPLEVIETLVDKLEQLSLLEGESFKQALGKKERDYRNSPARPASHAGLAYSADPYQLRRELDSYYAQANNGDPLDSSSDGLTAKGLIAPHIDIRAGGACFARGYGALAKSPPADLYIILGTGHAGVEGLFTVGGLDYETPLGCAGTDREFVAALSEEMGEDVGVQEILHKSEHVIEFQIVFLKHLFSEDRPFKVVPILCSLSHAFFDPDRGFGEQRQRFDKFSRALCAVASSYKGSVCYIASADLDHIGPRYGDSFQPSEAHTNTTMARDRQLMQKLEKMDLEGFIHAIAEDDDSGRICGFSPIVTMLSCMDASHGRLLDLDYAKVDDQGSYVSFASMIFY